MPLIQNISPLLVHAQIVFSSIFLLFHSFKMRISSSLSPFWLTLQQKPSKSWKPDSDQENSHLWVQAGFVAVGSSIPSIFWNKHWLHIQPQWCLWCISAYRLNKEETNPEHSDVGIFLMIMSSCDHAVLSVMKSCLSKAQLTNMEK